MKILLLGLILLASISSFGSTEIYKYERETFKGKFSKIGESFVCMPAYSEAKDKAWEAGYPNCSTQYKYNLTRSWLNKDKITCTAYVECSKRVRVETIESGEAQASYE